MPASVTLNRLLARDEVARFVDKSELSVVSSDAATYGLAMVVDKNFNVVYHTQKGDPPRQVGDGELTLIATNEVLRINFHSGVPSNDNKRAAGVHLDRITEVDPATGKERTVRLKATLEFKIDRHNREVADEIYALMRSRGKMKRPRLTKKELLSDFGAALKEHVQNFIQTAVDDVGGVNLSAPIIQNREAQSLGPVMSKMGLTFIDIVINPDKRPAWQRFILPSPSYDSRWALAAKIIVPIVIVGAPILGGLYGGGVFEPPPERGVLRIDNGAAMSSTVSCEVVGSEQADAGVCSAIAGEKITVQVHSPSLTQVDASETTIEAFERWDCPVDSPWCAGVDRTQTAITLTVPQELGEFVIAPIYRADRLVKLRIETSEPRIANIPAATVRAQDCSGTKCARMRDGAGYVYVFQARADEPAPIVTLTPPDNSQYNFNSLQCDGGQCPTNGAAGLTLTLEEDVTAWAVYSEQVELTIVNQGIDFGESKSDIPPRCQSRNGTIRCLFDQDEPVNLTLVAERSSDTRRFLHWQCEGGDCGALQQDRNSVFSWDNKPLGGNVTITPVFENITFTVLTFRDAEGGSVSAECQETNGCRDEAGWNARVIAQSDSGHVFARWDCVGAPCPGFLEANPLRLTLDDNVTLTPIFEAIPTVALNLGTSPNGRATADCGSDCEREPGWRAAVTATPNNGYRFANWDCAGDSCPSSRQRTANPLRLTLADDVTLTPIFEAVTTASLTIGISANGAAEASCGSECDREPGWNATVTATPADGYEFADWECTGSCPSGAISPRARLTITEDTRITPVFRSQQGSFVGAPQVDLETRQVISTERGRFAGARVAPTEDLTRLGNVPLPDCGNTAAGQPNCARGTIYFVNYASNLTDSSGAASRGPFNSGALPSGTAPKVDQTLTAVHPGLELWASYVRFDSDDQTTPVNVIGQNYNRVLVVVEDDDQIGRNIAIVRQPYPDNGNIATLNYGVTLQEDLNLPIIDDNPLPGVAPEGATILNDIEVIVAPTNTITAAAVIAGAEASAAALRGAAVDGVQRPDSVSQVRPIGAADPSVDITATLPAVSDRAAHSVFYIWETPRHDNNVVVQIRGNEGEDAFLALAETDRGTGRFVGELLLVDGKVNRIRNAYTAELNASGACINNAQGDACMRVFNASRGDVNGVAGTVLRLPVENEADITARYIDKIGVQGSRNAAVSSARYADFRTDSTPPVVEIREPVADFATNSRRQTFSGTAYDTQSGLEPASLRLVISNPQQASARIASGDPITDHAVNVPRPRPRENGILSVGFPDIALGVNTIRILEGTEDDDSGLYAEWRLFASADPDYIDGQVRVGWGYLPGTGAAQLFNRNLDDTFIPFTAYIRDLAGNVGYADGDEDAVGDQPHEFKLDNTPPSLIARSDNPLTITFNNASGNPSRNLAVRVTRENNVTVGQTQTGVIWDSSQRALIASQRAIMVAFDERIASAVAGDFDVDFDTSGFSPNIVAVIVPPRNLSASTFENRLTDAADAAALAEIVRNSVFLVFDRDIPSNDTPNVEVEDVEDLAGNSIDDSPAAGRRVDAHDGIG